jgi:glutamyl-tRNA reductase
MVANRTFDRAIDVARELGGMPLPWEQVGRYLPLADLVVSAVGADEYVIRPAALDEAMRERRHRPVFLIDLSVPRSIDPGVNAIDEVYLYNVDDLEAVVAENRGARAEEATKAETMVDAEVDAFWRWLTTLDAVPTIVALRDKLEAIRQAEVARLLPAMNLADPRQREAVERLTTSIVNKILHDPLTVLRRHKTDPSEAFYIEAARLLFQLDADADADPDADDGDD